MRYLALVFLLLSHSAFSQECSSVIALSKITSVTVSDKDTVEQNAENFCNEYSTSAIKSKSSKYGASYKFLSASFGSSGASEEAVASKYCSAKSNFLSSKDVYKNYIETISPDAYPAYEQCLQVSKDIKFQINIGSILPEEFSLSASFASSGIGQKEAKISFTTSKGVTCRWDEEPGPTRTLLHGTSAILACSRDNPKKRSYVTLVTNTSAKGENLTLPWRAYNDDGDPVDTVATLEAKITSLNDKISSLQNKFDQAAFQAGEFPIRQIGTRPLTDASQCPDNADAYRGETKGRITFTRPFSSIPVVTVGLRHFDMSGDSNRIAVSVTSTDERGFNYSFATWCTTKVYGATASWMAAAK